MLLCFFPGSLEGVVGSFLYTFNRGGLHGMVGRSCCLRTRLNFLICSGVSFLEGLWGYRLSICVQFTPFAIDVCTRGNYPFTIENLFIFLCLCRCSFRLLDVLTPWFYLFFPSVIRSAAAQLCGDFDRRILFLVFYTENYTQTHTLNILHCERLCFTSVCFPSGVIRTKYTHTHTTLTDLVLRCFEKYGTQVPAPFPPLVPPTCRNWFPNAKDFCIYNIYYLRMISTA